MSTTRKQRRPVVGDVVEAKIFGDIRRGVIIEIIPSSQFDKAIRYVVRSPGFQDIIKRRDFVKVVPPAQLVRESLAA